MHLPMTSIQDAWGVRTLDDRSDITIKPPVRRCNTNNSAFRIIPPSPMPSPTTPSPMPLHPVVTPPQDLIPHPPVRPVVSPTTNDDQQLIGMLTILLIFLLADKLFTIWNKS